MKVGIDLVNSSRFEGKTNSFFDKYFTQNELIYAKSRKSFTETIAGVFACKEAFLKALGVGVFKGIELNEVEVCHDDNGDPYLNLSEKVKKNYFIANCSVSISHDNGFAIAICIIN